MLAITLTWLPQRSQTSMSILNTCLIEHPFEPLHPCHRPMALLMLLVEPIVIGRFRLLWLLVLATFGGRYLNTMLAIQRKDTVETGEIDSWPGRQGGRLGNKVWQ